MAKKLVLGLYTGCVDKLTAAGVVLSGAAADDMDIEIFVFLMAAHAFKKENAENNLHMAELPEKREEFLASLKNLQTPSWVEFFETAKEFTNVQVHVCSLAGKVWGGEKPEDFIDLVDDICGIGEYIDACQEADVNLFI